MKINKLKAILFLVLTTIIPAIQYCDLLDEDYDPAKLFGTWTRDGASGSLETTGGIDLYDVLIASFNYTEEDAEEKYNHIADELFRINGSLTFNENYTYTSNLSNLDFLPKTGKWELNPDGDLLFISNSVTIQTEVYLLDKESFNLHLRPQTSEADLDGDGSEETTLIYYLEIYFVK